MVTGATPIVQLLLFCYFKKKEGADSEMTNREKVKSTLPKKDDKTKWNGWNIQQRDRTLQAYCTRTHMKIHNRTCVQG